MAATVGNGRFASLPKTSCPLRTPLATTSAPEAFAISFTSAPAMKMSGLAETSRRALMSLLFASVPRRSSSSAMTGVEYLFAFSP